MKKMAKAEKMRKIRLKQYFVYVEFESGLHNRWHASKAVSL